MGGYAEGIAAADSEGSELCVASNADTDSEEDNLSSCSSEACSVTPLNAEAHVKISHGDENQSHEKISGSSWHNPPEILNLILKEAESSETVWTNDQHCSYLNSMEAAFVRNMFGKAYYAAERYGELKSRAQPRSSTSSPYAHKVSLSPGPECKRFRSSVLSHTDNPDCSKIKKDFEPSINVEYANRLDCQQDTLKRQLNSLEVPELESCIGQYAFASHQPSSRNGLSGNIWPDVSQVLGFTEKEKSHKYQKQFVQHASILEKVQHDNGLDKKVDLDQVVPFTYEIGTRLITDEPSPVAATKSRVEFKESCNKCQVPGIQTAKDCS